MIDNPLSELHADDMPMNPTIMFRNLLAAIRRGDTAEATVTVQYLTEFVNWGGILSEEIVAVMDFQTAWEDRR